MKRMGLVAPALLFALTGFAAVPGGLIVSVGEDTAAQVAKDWKTPGRVFQCLETDATKVSDLRKRIHAAGCYSAECGRIRFWLSAGATDEQGGFLSALKFWESDEPPQASEYLISLVGNEASTQVVVLDKEGKRDTTQTADRILALLHDQLR